MSIASTATVMSAFNVAPIELSMTLTLLIGHGGQDETKCCEVLRIQGVLSKIRLP